MISYEELKQIKKQILSQEVSLREISEIKGIDRDSLKEIILKICSEEEKGELKKVLEDNKINSTTIVVDENLKQILIGILKGDKSARKMAEGIDRETLRRKLEELANSSPEYVKYYLAYKTKRGDYSGINFRILFAEMIENNLSQSEIAKKYNIPVRTISRELEKIGKTEDELDKRLYSIAKICAERKMKRIPISIYEINLYKSILEEVKDRYKLVNIESKKSIRRRELENFCNIVNRLKAQGKTMQEIAEELDVRS